ncbi:MAG: hypothetical protein R2932_03765 [Caldilineaceae bacterium]
MGRRLCRPGRAARGIETAAAGMKLERRQRHSDRQGAMEFWGAEGVMVYRGISRPSGRCFSWAR